ncbi:MAG: ferrochelatase [Nitriliruptoraceae bacterium]
MNYDAFLLASFGGPEGPDDVLPFLENVTRGRGVPRERLIDVSHHYMELGGVSPINQQNRDLIAALEAEFDRRGIDLPIYWGNRFWDPFLKPALEELHADGHRRVLTFATSAYSSYSGCRAYREDLAEALLESGLDGELHLDKIRHYFDHPGFVTPFVEGLAAALRSLVEDGVPLETTRVLFVTHSIPTAMAAASGPPGEFDEEGAYVAQHLATARLVLDGVAAEGLELPAWSLNYQSRSGAPHIPWLEPDINDAITAVHAEGATAVVIVPIGFVSDHVEVIWDLDNEAQETCDELGVRMLRVRTPGIHQAFVTAIADLVEARIAGEPGAALSPLGPWREVCAIGCCANAQMDKPTVCGEDSTVGFLTRV